MNAKITDMKAPRIRIGSNMVTVQENQRTSNSKKGIRETRASDLAQNNQGVELTLTEQGRSMWQKTEGEQAESQKEQQILEEEQQKRLAQVMKESYQEQAENAKEAGKNLADTAKLMEVARRIARGDKVPFKDEKKLMEYNAKLYQTVKTAAMLRTTGKRKKYKSLFEEKDDMQKKLRELNQNKESEQAKTGEISQTSGPELQSENADTAEITTG